mmetsp:Transcript_51385/g.159385  ORF Transcript_51385/g.159385 Transcript_51385/m.159385 type:complete len:322 (+) Transcript_51385:174-1139(+)
MRTSRQQPSGSNNSIRMVGDLSRSQATASSSRPVLDGMPVKFSTHPPAVTAVRQSLLASVRAWGQLCGLMAKNSSPPPMLAQACPSEIGPGAIAVAGAQMPEANFACPYPPPNTAQASMRGLNPVSSESSLLRGTASGMEVTSCEEKGRASFKTCTQPSMLTQWESSGAGSAAGGVAAARPAPPAALSASARPGWSGARGSRRSLAEAPPALSAPPLTSAAPLAVCSLRRESRVPGKTHLPASDVESASWEKKSRQTILWIRLWTWSGILVPPLSMPWLSLRHVSRAISFRGLRPSPWTNQCNSTAESISWDSASQLTKYS